MSPIVVDFTCNLYVVPKCDSVNICKTYLPGSVTSSLYPTHIFLRFAPLIQFVVNWGPCDKRVDKK